MGNMLSNPVPEKDTGFRLFQGRMMRSFLEEVEILTRSISMDFISALRLILDDSLPDVPSFPFLKGAGTILRYYQHSWNQPRLGT